jgi:lysophospholipase L1-like esterase
MFNDKGSKGMFDISNSSSGGNSKWGQFGHGYNIENGLKAYKDNLAKYQTQIVRIYCFGDSIVEGVGSGNMGGTDSQGTWVNRSWPGVLRTNLSELYGDGGVGWIGAKEWLNTINLNRVSMYNHGTSANVTFGDTGGATGMNSFSNGGVHGKSYKFGSNKEVRFPNLDGNKIHMFYTDEPGGNGGKASVFINSTSVETNIGDNTVTVSTPRPPKSYNVTQSTTNQIGIRCTSGNFNIQGIMIDKGTSGIQVNKIGYGGFTAGDYLLNNGSIVQAISYMPTPHLAMIGLGMNDLKTKTREQYKDNMRTLATAWKNTGASVMFTSWGRPSSAWHTNYRKYLDFVRVQYELCDELDICLYDISSAWNTDYDFAQKQGWYSDSTTPDGIAGSDPCHPSNAGYNNMASLFTRALIL